jgi:hypothetical protein
MRYGELRKPRLLQRFWTFGVLTPIMILLPPGSQDFCEFVLRISRTRLTRGLKCLATKELQSRTLERQHWNLRAFVCHSLTGRDRRDRSRIRRDDCVWCFAARSMVNHPKLGKPIRRYGHRFAPIVLIGLGILIIYRAGSLGLLLRHGGF